MEGEETDVTVTIGSSIQMHRLTGMELSQIPGHACICNGVTISRPTRLQQQLLISYPFSDKGREFLFSPAQCLF